MSVATLNQTEKEVKIRKPLRREARTFATGLTREQLVESVGNILAGMISQPDDLSPFSSKTKPSSPFHAKKVPSISLLSYIQRFAQFSGCSDSCFVILLIFVDKIAEADPDFELDPLNVHRITLLSLVSAAKYQDDVYLKNKGYAEIGGLKTEDLNKLELEFLLNSLNFKLYVEESVFKKYQKYCEDYFSKKINEKRN